MAWSAPRTWVSLEVVSAAIMNTHVRDNLLETGPAKVTTAGDMLIATGANALTRIPKGSLVEGSLSPLYTLATADESVSSSTTYQDDDELELVLEANKNYVFELLAGFVSASSNPDVKMRFGSLPSGATGQWFNVGAAGSSSKVFGSGEEAYALGADALQPVFLEGVINVGGTGGTVAFQWAQNTSDATATIRKAGSFTRATVAD